MQNGVPSLHTDSRVISSPLLMWTMETHTSWTVGVSALMWTVAGFSTHMDSGSFNPHMDSEDLSSHVDSWEGSQPTCEYCNA